MTRNREKRETKSGTRGGQKRYSKGQQFTEQMDQLCRTKLQGRGSWSIRGGERDVNRERRGRAGEG